MLRREVKILLSMYGWLEYLAGETDTFGDHGIAEAVLLWEKYFQTDLLYKQVTTLLSFKGGQQQGWFPTANHSHPLTEELSEFRISSSKFPSWTTRVSHSAEIFEASKGAIECVSDALMLEEGEAIKSHPVHTFCQKACSLIEEQSSFVDSYIRTFSLTQLSRALKIQKWATQRRMMAQIAKAENYHLNEPKEKKQRRLYSPALLPPTTGFCLGPFITLKVGCLS